MTDPTKRKRFRRSFFFGAMVTAGAIALLIAYLFGAFEKRGNIQADDICRQVPSRQETAKIFNSVLPKASKYQFDGTWRPDQNADFRSTCFVTGDDENSLFALTAEMGSARPWQEWVKDEIPPNDGGKIDYFDAGLKGVSNAEVALIWVPCYSSEKQSKQPWSMTVLADALKPLDVSDKEARQTLIDLATDFARQAHKDAKCDLPSKLPS